MKKNVKIAKIIFQCKVNSIVRRTKVVHKAFSLQQANAIPGKAVNLPTQKTSHQQDLDIM